MVAPPDLSWAGSVRGEVSAAIPDEPCIPEPALRPEFSRQAALIHCGEPYDLASRHKDSLNCRMFRFRQELLRRHKKPGFSGVLTF